MANSLLGAGGCLRKDSGIWIVGFSKFIGLGNSLQAKLWAILLGLEIISKLPHISKVEEEIDSIQAIDLLLHGTTDFHHLGTIIDNCMFILSSLEDFRISKGTKQQNRSTNTLAKEGRTKRLPLPIYEDAPDYVARLYHEDLSLSPFPS